MKEFIEKLIDRLEEEKQRLRNLKNNCIALSDHEVIAIEEGAYNFCKEIVNQLSEEYINTSTTNADKIRSMTDEGLAEFLCKLDTMGTEPKSLWNGEFWIDEGEELLNWLQSEVEGE